ncbi:MarR family winged helix-turn-helix transcriptional regulator [Bacillus dakarensis]|uniref:MarR family winged helix-turn-helix transcriptional regulator n=1 Tax=Robertmurraya dakarensis TaxID=1926278 RepID=UPI000981BCDE|nr:MarR family transcriptional regulator [Bacillus dakarensis]
MQGKCSNQPYLLLMQTSKAIQERIKTELVPYKLNLTEFSVLEVLHLKGTQTIQQVGHSILISSGSMTYVIDKLEQRGLLERKACPNDRRAIHVLLTEDGTNLMTELMPMHQELVDDMFSDLDHEEAETIVKLLEKVNRKPRREFI